MNVKSILPVLLLGLVGCGDGDGDPEEATCPAPGRECGGIVGEVVLLRQEFPSSIDPLFADIAKAEADFWDYEAMPRDEREEFFTAAGERCTFEAGTMYPSSYNETYWPTGPGRGVGDLSFRVEGGEGDIALEAWDIDGGGDEEWGWAYDHGDKPPPLQDETTTWPDFFDSSYLPAGASFSVATAGGPHVGPKKLSPGELPQTFTISQPDELTPAAVSAAQDLALGWGPAQPGATMEVFVTAEFAGSYLLLTCTVEDDGAATIPAEALSSFQLVAALGIQLRRSIVNRVAGTTLAGEPLQVDVIGRYARLGAPVPLLQQ